MDLLKIKKKKKKKKLNIAMFKLLII